MVSRINEFELEHEYSERSYSRRSHETIASHNQASEDENIQCRILFRNTPRSKSPVKSLYASPAKYCSPVKKDFAKESMVLLRLREVEVDKEPNEECSKAYLESMREVSERNGKLVEEMCGANEEGRESRRVSRDCSWGQLDECVEGRMIGIEENSERERNTGRAEVSEIDDGRRLEGRTSDEETGRIGGFGEGNRSDQVKEGENEKKWIEKERIEDARRSFSKYEASCANIEEKFGMMESPQRIAMKNKFINKHKEAIEVEFAFDSCSDDYNVDAKPKNEVFQHISESPTKETQKNELKSNLPIKTNKKDKNPDDEVLNLTIEIQETKVQPTNTGCIFPKFKKLIGQLESDSPFNHDLKPPTKANEKSIKSISLHRKMISFEEDCDNARLVGLTQIISPLPLSNGFADFDFVDEVANNNSSKDEKIIKDYEEDKIEAIINEKSNTFQAEEKRNEFIKKLVPSETLKDLKKECIINLQSKFNKEFSKRLEFSSDSSLNSSYSSKKPLERLSRNQMALENSSSRRQVFSSSSSSKEIIENNHSNSQFNKSLTKSEGITKKGADLRKPSTKRKAAADALNEEINQNNRARSQIERKVHILPPRPSKSRDLDRAFYNMSRDPKENEIDEQAPKDFRREGKLDMNIVKKLLVKKNLIKDKTIFNKKSKKEMLKHVEKLLESKENQQDDPDIIRLKSMLASRQSFKKKHVELTKENPYNQRIQAVLSGGNTPNEEYRIDPNALKRRKERLRRISSIYSSKKSNESFANGKISQGTLSPSKSENAIKRGSMYL